MQNKNKPPLTEEHKLIYIKLCAEYGIHQNGIKNVNGEMLNILGLPPTPENRSWCTNKFRSVHPTNTAKKKERKMNTIIIITSKKKGLNPHNFLKTTNTLSSIATRWHNTF